jgi:hypothetical protein
VGIVYRPSQNGRIDGIHSSDDESIISEHTTGPVRRSRETAEAGVGATTMVDGDQSME